MFRLSLFASLPISAVSHTLMGKLSQPRL